MKKEMKKDGTLEKTQKPANCGYTGLATVPFQKFPDPFGWNKEKIERYQQSGHKWLEDENGEVEIFAHSKGNCNGPICTVCGYSPCWHCEPTPKQGHCC